MTKIVLAAACAMMIVVLSAESVSAQPPPPGVGYYRPPAFSPYLNLLRGGGSPALNYYGIVRPEMQFRQSIQNLATEVGQQQAAIGNLATTGSPLPTTGHPTQFMNLGGYFMNSGGGQFGVAPVRR